MKKVLLYTILLALTFSCKKQNEWLDVKSNKSDVIPSTMEDFQALLDNYNVMNTNYPAIGIIGADNSYVSDATALSAGEPQERNAYKWASDIYENNLVSGIDWAHPYKIIEYANVVLDGLQNSGLQKNTISDNIKGQALFFRAFSYYHLLQIFSKQYNPNAAGQDLGVPLKLEPDINPFLARSSLQEVYDQILTDLTNSEALLQVNSSYKTRPSKSAAQTMLAKVYLNMGNYVKAKEYCDLVLKNKNSLLDLNTLNASLVYPLPTLQSNSNPEIIFYSITFHWAFNNPNNSLVSDELYQLYDDNDLRKTIFFRTNPNGSHRFRGSYSGSASLFNGLSTNEILLIRAECMARIGDYERAMTDLNTLLKERWKKVNGVSTYVAQTANNENSALTLILLERRKDLPFSGNLRWEDLKRLNNDPRFAKTLKRTINGQQYTLPPNDNRYVYPVPPIETNINTKIINNPR